MNESGHEGPPSAKEVQKIPIKERISAYLMTLKQAPYIVKDTIRASANKGIYMAFVENVWSGGNTAWTVTAGITGTVLGGLLELTGDPERNEALKKAWKTGEPVRPEDMYQALPLPDELRMD